ncbi:retrovirus-related pol polyprotein from transposon TNT 1-94 [Tanacetum coccineum]|uniref:Retrovirus-related pol polyprotein from transposon TNT 1-94 n=1 Tax=Tanacetum coccineum TaxID=301880 RepID=A0ABQ5GHB5_9ASTR
MSQQKDDQKKFYKTREEIELEKVIALENKIKVLDDIVYKTGQSVQTINMLNRNCKTSFVKPEFLKKAQRANSRLYDIGCYIDNLALMLTPESDETIRLAQESPSKLNLEVAFRTSTCYIRVLKGNDILIGSRGIDLYSITLQDTFTPNPICLMAKASSTQTWLWNRRLSHLNFNTINLLSKYDIVTGLPKLRFIKDHLCSSCELGKAKRKSFKIKTTPSSKRRLQILHMDLCGPMRVESFNGKKYVLVIIDDYSRYTWTRFLRSKDETPEVLIDFLKLVQRGLHA